MLPRDIRDRVKSQPFHPLRVFISDGAHYDVPHPDMILVSTTLVAIGLPPDEGDLPSRLAHIDPEQITRIEPIPQSNGKRSKKGRS